MARRRKPYVPSTQLEFDLWGSGEEYAATAATRSESRTTDDVDTV